MGPEKYAKAAVLLRELVASSADSVKAGILPPVYDDTTGDKLQHKTEQKEITL